MTKAEDVKRIRQRLRRAWVPFFARFGGPNDIQFKAIPLVLAGANVVIASPTASGKTEAVVAPVAEKFHDEQWEGLAIVYVVPTRALANDTVSRIEGPLNDMGMRVAIKHGDKPSFSESKVPNLLITTPESLDSLLCRSRTSLSNIRAAILDEIHLLDNTYRGDQLRILLGRIRRRLTTPRLYTHLLSATLGDPKDIASRYVVNFEVVSLPGQRTLQSQILTSPAEVCQIAKQHGWKRMLCFCNRRESVECLASELSELWSPYTVVTHHGSLSRRERENAETLMKEADVWACVATSTLEIGVDIGDVDVVVLAEVPWSISGLLQRVGRGNRRKGHIQAVGIANSKEERSLLESMFDAAKKGALASEEYTPDISVAVQQIFSYLYQHPQGSPVSEIVDMLSPLCDEVQANMILAHLSEREWLERRAGFWFASTRLMDLGEKGRIHSNIPDSTSYKVINADNGQEVGTIAGTFDDIFVLAQRAWRVITIGDGTIMARRFRGKASPPMFQRNTQFGAFHAYLPKEFRALTRSGRNTRPRKRTTS